MSAANNGKPTAARAVAVAVAPVADRAVAVPWATGPATAVGLVVSADRVGLLLLAHPRPHRLQLQSNNAKKLQSPARLHANRVTGGDRYYRDSGRSTFARAQPRQGQGAGYALPEQPEADRNCNYFIC